MAIIEEADENSLTPIIKWAQNGSKLNVTADLSDVKDALINFEESSLVFQGYGHGAKGEDLYHFRLDFLKEINKEKCTYKINDRNVYFDIEKKEIDEWPRLLKATMKPVWLRIDFDRWKIDDSEDEKQTAEDEDVEQQLKKISFETRIKSEVEKAQEDIKIWTKLAWLTVYNCVQFACFAVIFSKLMICLWKHKYDAPLYFYNEVIDLFLTCQLAAFIEIINPLVGIVKTGLQAPFMQVFGRNFILFVLLMPEKRFHQDSVVFVLFIVWSFIEIIRYPFYLLGLYRYNNKVMTWLRYNIWIPLYPTGFTSEAIIMYRSIPFSLEKKRMEYNMPNALNFQFSLRGFTILYLVCYIPLCCHLLKHMWKLRQRKTGGAPRKPKQA
ncbi:very-long-chain (3R)-3-hydroxyacyl-CoA dehydratase-like isoform X2 [Clytia hemisphaerica]|uniref:very-long-chain (3R)-3-hydroxyacyl-CoA dehydratase-like isoform X2 n=1 Tax=Clytia hemisphaerica TaxID=252671 RepID=UPI0034D5C559